METELIALIIAIGAFIAFFFVKGIIDEKRKEKDYILKLKFNFGKYPEREYTNEQFSGISGYDRKNKTDNHIDNITWDDLDMDSVFMSMNNTHSSAGEEYLYYRLRNPKLTDETTRRDEELIEYFYNNKDDSINLQKAFHKMGKTGKYSLYDYLNYLDNVENTGNIKHIICNLLYLISAALVFFNPFAGIVCIISVMCYNMIAYSKAKSEIEPYFISIKYVMRLLDGINKVADTNVPVIKDNIDIMKEKRKVFHGLKKKALFLSMDASDFNLLSMIYIYIKMLFHVDLIIFNYILKNIKKHTAEINDIVTELGYIESSIAVASYRKYVNDFCVPEYTDTLYMKAEEMYHPLISNPVKNSFETNNGVLVTGSNASGKSTFLKTIAINAILAQTINTCLADKFITNHYRIYSSMALRDNLGIGESYYIVEIKSLKRILDRVNPEVPILCFVDEILRGTNTLERIAASSEILVSLARKNVLCFAATHDIELTHILEDDYSNYHFQEQIVDNNILFDYKLYEGRAVSKNAIKLLSIMGYSNEIIERATDAANHFQVTGKWKNIVRK